MAAKVTWVVICRRKRDLITRLKFTIFNQPVQKLGKMKHFDVRRKNPAVVGMKPLKAACTGDHNCPHLFSHKHFCPFQGLLKKLVVSHAAELACAAGLLLTKYRKINPCLLKKPRRLNGHRLHRGIEARSASCEI